MYTRIHKYTHMLTLGAGLQQAGQPPRLHAGRPHARVARGPRRRGGRRGGKAPQGEV